MSEQALGLEEKLQKLKESYIDDLSKKIKNIHKSWNSLTNNWRQETLEELHIMIHSLAGSAGTFGFDHVSKVAHLADNILKDYREEGVFPDKSKNNELNALIEKLSCACNEIVNYSGNK